MSGGGRLRVLGIDPGTAVTGWGVVERRRGTFVHLAHGTIRTPARAALPQKLGAIHAALDDCCTEWRPTIVALEKSFVGRNVQSAFRLGEVRGVAMLIAERAGCAVAEYAPSAVKMAVTGSGRAEKPQVQRMIAHELRLAEAVPADAADALAIAMCHLQSSGLQQLLPARRRGSGRRMTLADVARLRSGVTG